MFVKVLRNVGVWKEGSHEDVPADIAAEFIKRGYLEESNAGDWMKASMAAQAAQEKTDTVKLVADEVTRLLKANGVVGGETRKGPPNGGGHVDFKTIAAGEAPSDAENALMQKRKGRGIGEVLRCIGVAGKPHIFGPQMAAHASRRLQAMSDEVTEYRFDDNTGEFSTHITRKLDDGGIETVTRTGSDSLSGGATYGFSLKPEWLGTLFEISMEQQVFASAAQRIPVGSGNEVKWPAWDQYQAPAIVNGIQQSAVFAGITLGYVGETATRPNSDGKLNMIDFKIVDLTGFTALSRDFVVDNYLAMDAAITRMFGRAIGWMEDYMSLQGAGNGQPQGAYNSSATLVVNRAAANKIRPVDLTTMISKVSPMVWDQLRWITNITTFPQLSILYDGTSYVFQPNALISQAMKLSAQEKSIGGSGAELMHRPMGDLLGFPLYFSEKVPTLGNTADLALVAPSQYGIADRSGLEMSVSEHFYFSTDLIAYKFKKRHDMKSLWRAPYLQADGSQTQVSPFVILH